MSFISRSFQTCPRRVRTGPARGCSLLPSLVLNRYEKELSLLTPQRVGARSRGIREHPRRESFLPEQEIGPLNL